MLSNDQSTKAALGKSEKPKKFKHSPSLFTRIFTKEKLSLPDGWASYNCEENGVRTLLFSQLTLFQEHPIMLRQVILHENLTLKYFVGRHEVRVVTIYLPPVLKMEADIATAIISFSNVSICSGLLNSNRKNTNPELFFDKDMFTWRHKLCSFMTEGVKSNCCKHCRPFRQK